MIAELLARLPDGFDLRVEPVANNSTLYHVTLCRLSLPDDNGRRRTVVYVTGLVERDGIRDADAVAHAVSLAMERIAP